MTIGKSGRINDHELFINDHRCTANGYGYDPGVSRFLDTSYVLWTRMGEISMPVPRADFHGDRRAPRSRIVAADVSPLMIPARKKFEPTHVGCYGVPNWKFYPQISRMLQMRKKKSVQSA